MTAPEPQAPGQSWEPMHVLLDLLDLAAVVDQRCPAFRYISTERIRETITGTAGAR